MNSHLTDESFADLLAGEGSPEARAHLEGCAVCRAEVEQVGGAVAGLRRQSLDWAELRSAARPMPPAGSREVSAWRGGAVQRWVGLLAGAPLAAVPVALAAVLLVWVAVDGGDRGAGHPGTVVHRHEVGSLTADNELLLSIDKELSVQDTSPNDLYGTASAQSDGSGSSLSAESGESRRADRGTVRE